MNPFEPPKSAPSGRRQRRREDDQQIDPMAVIAFGIIAAAIVIGQWLR